MGVRVYGNYLHCFCNFSASLKYFKVKNVQYTVSKSKPLKTKEKNHSFSKNYSLLKKDFFKHDVALML